MTRENHNDLWRDFPKTAMEFEARFATEADCRAYWIEARWGGQPACARCGGTRVWTIREGTTFECADCGHQTSLTSGTVLEKTCKPFKMWFHAYDRTQEAPPRSDQLGRMTVDISVGEVGDRAPCMQRRL